MSSSLSIQDRFNQVTVEDLSRTIRSAVESESIGVPVNVRLHWEIPTGTQSLSEAAESAVAIVDAALELNAPEFRVRRSTSGSLLHVLCEDSRGRTALITLAETPIPRFAMTIYGNHGVARIEETVLFLPKASGLEEQPTWLNSLRDLLH